ncbi:general amidase protein [Rutstroemia sp. NJR-2017a WRK4]|nr:general amidase protein [Rutstroemia sp. NJR-2017a WRK4]
MGRVTPDEKIQTDLTWIRRNDFVILQSLIGTISSIKSYWFKRLLKKDRSFQSKSALIGWQVTAKKKRDSVNALIPQQWRLDHVPSIIDQRDVTGKYIQQFLTDREIEITETDAVGIVEKTTTGVWTAREVCEAFCHRAALAHQLVNCLHEIFFEEAIAKAQKLDDYYADHQKPIGPLHGLPVSLKDQFHVKGVETTMGYVGWIGTFQGEKATGKERSYESVMVEELRSLGAILFCKTSVPQTLMAGDTRNNIFGITENPKNRLLGPGGSSGGEGALIGLKGSPVGIGTDIGGSIRIPAAFNGLYGLRPSSGRLPFEGLANSMDGQNTTLSVVGPLATTARSLRFITKAILSTEPWLHDPLVCEIPWRDVQERTIIDAFGFEGAMETNGNFNASSTSEIAGIPMANGDGKTNGVSKFDVSERSKPDVTKPGSEKLAFALMISDQEVSPQPPVARAIRMAIDAVRKLGHTVIEWDPPSHQRGNAIGSKAWSFDGGKDIHNALALSGEPVIPQLKKHFGTLKPQMAGFDIAEVNRKKREFQKEYMEYWNSTAELTGTGRPVDAIITPLAPMPANIRTSSNYIAYTTFVNLLDYTASILPVTTVDKNIDLFDHNYKPLNPADEQLWKSYDPEIYDGAHVGLQIVGRRFQEEKILAITEMLAAALEQ